MANLFKVLRGAHSEGGRTYNRGEVVDSASDLSKHNSPGSVKFERIMEADPAVYVRRSEQPLEDLTVKELRKLAADEDIDLTQANGKDEIINTIRTVREGG